MTLPGSPQFPDLAACMDNPPCCLHSSFQYFCLPFCNCLLICTKWSLQHWWNVLRMYLFQPRFAWGICLLWQNVYAELDGMLGMAWLHAPLFFRGHNYTCALIHWLTLLDKPDEDTRIWVVQLEFEGNGHHTVSIIHTFCPFMVLLFYRTISTSWIPLIYSMHTLLYLIPILAMNFYNNKWILSYLFI